MTNFARVEAGKVVEVHEHLPANWRHISNFYTLGSDERALAAHGWFRVQRQAFDLSEFVVSSARYVYDGASVRESLALTSRNAPPVADVAQAAMRAERDQRLAASDWTQSFDLSQRFAQWSAEWSAYRQALRDFPFAWEQSGRAEPLPQPPRATPTSAQVRLHDRVEFGGASSC